MPSKKKPAASGRYRVLADGLDWPVGASLDLVRERGGRSRLTAEEQAALECCRPACGEIVDSVPPESAAWLVEQGYLDPDAEEP